MNKFLLSVLFFSLLSCSQKKEEGKEETPQQQTQSTQEASEPTYFQSEQYPLRINYLLPGLEMEIQERHYIRGEKLLSVDESYAYSEEIIELKANLTKEFYDEINANEDYETWYIPSIFTFYFYPTEQDFKDFLSERPTTLEEKFVILGGIPAKRMTRRAYIDSYILFTPGIYVRLSIEGENVRKHDPEISQKRSDRVADITKQMLQRIQWLKPIDTNSQEFKAWKQHILDLIAEANRRGSGL